MTISTIVFQSPWFVYVNTVLALFYVFTQAKGKIATQFIGIVYFCFYVFICFSQKYYGEAFAYLLVMLPMYIYGVIHWLHNRNKKENVVIIRRNLSLKEWLIASVCMIAVAVGVFFFLKELKTAELIVNWLSFVTLLPAVYLLIRRCKWNHLGFLINDFIVPFLWLFLVIDGNMSFLPMFIYHIFQITYDIYGLVQWIKLEKKQKEEHKNEQYL